jgi:hypothetical protein
MVRLLSVLFWVSLIVGTYVTGNVLGNWGVCLLALFFFIRSRRRQRQDMPAETSQANDAGVRRSSPGPLSSSVSRTQLGGQSHAPRRRWR